MNQWAINLDNIIKNDAEFILAGDLACFLKMNTVTSVGSCLLSIEEHKLSEFVEKLNEQSDEAGSELLLITMMILQAEGHDIKMDADYYTDSFMSMVNYLHLELMHRKGIVELAHENISLDEMCADLKIVKLTDVGRELADKMKDDEND